MSYLYVLERIEEGRLNVKQALKEIEKESKRRERYTAKKVKIHIVNEGKAIWIPAIRFGMLKGVLKACPPFMNFIKKHASIEQNVSEEIDEGIDILIDIIDLLKDYPPIEFVRMTSKEEQVTIYTK